MATGTAQQMQRRGSRQHHGPAAVELVNALTNQPLVQEFLQTRRKPSTLSALERRWFVGRQRLATARDKHNSLSKVVQAPRYSAKDFHPVGST
jgi:lipid A disaccharide synthetase